MKNVLLSIQVILMFGNLINSSRTASSDSGIGQKSRKQHSRWTSEMQNSLLEICRNIPSNEPYYFDKIKKRWRELHPDYNVCDRTLAKKFYEIPNEITGRVKRPQRMFKWNREKTDELIELYLNSRPYNESHSVHLREEWVRRHPDCATYKTNYLTFRAQRNLRERSPHAQGESSQQFFEWTNKQDSDLYHVHQVTLPEGRHQPIHMHRIWADLHPNYRELTHNQLAERVKYLQKNSPDEHFPWTEGQNKELLDMYHSTSPEVADQGRRIYEIWSKIHPRYSFMTPYYLQVHASTLAHHEKLKSSKKKKYSRLTDEMGTNLADMYQRLAKQNQSLNDFHKAWVREYPALAHFTVKHLRKRARNLIRRDDPSDLGESNGLPRIHVGEISSGNTKFGFRKIEKYTPEEKAQLLVAYRQAYPREPERGERERNEWVKRNKNAADKNGRSLREFIKKWDREDSDKKGKAPMMIPKVEAESELSPNNSDSSK